VEGFLGQLTLAGHEGIGESHIEEIYVRSFSSARELKNGSVTVFEARSLVPNKGIFAFRQI